VVVVTSPPSERDWQRAFSTLLIPRSIAAKARGPPRNSYTMLSWLRGPFFQKAAKNVTVNVRRGKHHGASS
jgi:hypothetical protein